MEVKDGNGNLLAEGDSVKLIKDLKVKGFVDNIEKRNRCKKYSSDGRRRGN